jgi:antitoxin component YwqK of YwqJK toxin-antitoxin module
MRGYKIFEADYTCRGYKYSVNDWNIHDGEVKVRESGFHFCPRALDCLEYYGYDPENTYAEVECDDEYIVDRDKVVCKRLKITKTLTYEEFGKLLTGDISTPLKKCSYVDGKLHGDYRRYHENGQLLVETKYSNGELNGSYKEWREDGMLKTKTTYKDGLEDGLYEMYNKNGGLFIKSHFKDGYMYGISRQWHENGILFVERDYFTRDILNGTCKHWNSKGQLVLESHYKNGMLHGSYKEWYSDGTPHTEKTYTNGKIDDGSYKEWDIDRCLVSSE